MRVKSRKATCREFHDFFARDGLHIDRRADERISNQMREMRRRGHNDIMARRVHNGDIAAQIFPELWRGL